MDPELEAIRQKRMQEIMASGGGGPGGGGPGGGGGMSAEQQQQQQEAQEAKAVERQQMLMSILQPQAKMRLNNIALVKPEKARAVEDLILQAAKRGQLGEKVSEERLIGLLEQINEQQGQKTKVTIQHRRSAFDDDEEGYVPKVELGGGRRDDSSDDGW